METVIRTSPTLTKITTALLTAKKNMGPVLKDKTNPAFKSKYADLGAILDVTDPALEAVGIVMVQGAGGDGSVVPVETMLIHAESGEFIAFTMVLKPTKADPQGAGSAFTYGRRYGAQGMCGISPEDDDGNAASRASRAVARPVTTIGDGANARPGVSLEHKRRVLAQTLFSKLNYTEAERHAFYESVAGYTSDGAPITRWVEVEAAGKAPRVIDELQKLVALAQDAGVIG